MIECIGKKTRNNRLSTYVKALYALGDGTLKTVELNNKSVLKAPNDPQDFVPEIIQDPGEPLGPPIKPMPDLPLPEDTDNADGNSVVDLNQPIPILDAIDAINVPEIVPAVVPDEAPEAAAPQVLATTGEDSDTNTEVSQVIDRLGTPTVVVHDTKWYKDDLVSSIDINGAIPDRDFGIRTPVGEVITRNSDKPNKYSRFDYLLFMFPPEEIKLIVRLTNAQFEKHSMRTTTIGEILKVFWCMGFINKV